LKKFFRTIKNEQEFGTVLSVIFALALVQFAGTHNYLLKKHFINEKMSPETNTLNWFEIPATDISREKKFYESIFQIKMEEMEMPNMKFFAYANPN